MKKNNKKGFTLAELLIVVAIIAVLTAIAIPVFSTQLEKARIAADKANVRSWYAEEIAKYLTDPDTVTLPTTYDGETLKAAGASCVPSGAGESWKVTYTNTKGDGLTLPGSAGSGATP